MTKPDLPTFRHWLSLGLGRPAVFLQENDAEPYLGEILNACLHCLVYDRQCEESRVPYLWRLIGFTHRPEFFRDALSSALQECQKVSEDYAWSQIFGLARHFAAAGDERIKLAMYGAFEALGFETAGAGCAEDLILLDGVDAFTFVINLYDVDSPDKEDWELDFLFGVLEEKIGKDEARRYLDLKAGENPKFKGTATAVERLCQERQEYKEKAKKSSPPMDYLTWKKNPSEGSSAILSLWSRNASPEELKTIADDLANVMDTHQLCVMLFVFRNRPFSGDVQVLLPLLDDKRKEVKRRALEALQNVRHPDVRKQALLYMDSDEKRAEGMRLLAGNFESGDWQRLERELPRIKGAEDMHYAGYAIEEILEKFSQPEAKKSLLFMYENNPCSLCRRKIVLDLRGLGDLPEWMRHECAYDAEPETAEAAVAAAEAS